MSPPFMPPKGGKGQKTTGGSCCIYRKGMVVWLSRKGLSAKRQCRAILPACFSFSHTWWFAVV